MVARVKISTTVEPDGSIRLLEHSVSSAGIQAGDQVQVEVVKAAEPAETRAPSDTSPPEERSYLSAEELSALPFDEWVAYGQSLFDFQGLTYEEIRRQSREAAADEFWETFNRGDE